MSNRYVTRCLHCGELIPAHKGILIVHMIQKHNRKSIIGRAWIHQTCLKESDTIAK